MLKIISVRHYKKTKYSDSSVGICCWRGPPRLQGITMKVLTPRTLEMSLQRAPILYYDNLKLLFYILFYLTDCFFTCLILYFSYLIKCCHITSETSMFHSAILDTRLQKSILKVMLKIISVGHYKKQSERSVWECGDLVIFGCYDEGF